MPRRPQPLLVRITHWLNVPVLTIMAMSGLQIFAAYPYFGPRGATYDWLPFQNWMPPSWMRAGQWLAGARNLHFALGWVLVINAVVYLVYLGWSREFRRRFFWPPRDIKPAIQQIAYYLRLRKEPPPQPDDEMEASMRAALAELDPDPLFRRRLRGRVLNGYVEVREGMRPLPPSGRAGRIGRAALYASMTAALAAGAVAAVSNDALPGDPLYGAKIVI